MNAPETTVIRFGVFELDLAARQLRKNGTRIKLQDQPFRVLQLLVERAGEVVTREELKAKLWSDDTFVEFDHSLNTAIQKIRAALGDSAPNPRFLETVPRLGYRFVAPIAPVVKSPIPTLSYWGLAAGLAGIVVLVFVVASRPGNHEKTTVIDPASYRLRQLTRDSGLTFQPAISSDGRLIAYASDRDGQGNLDIYIQQTDGGEPTRLTNHSADDYAPNFSPSAGHIVFRSDRVGGGVYVIRTLAGGSERLLAPGGRDPKFSPAGERICFWRGRGLPLSEIFTISPAGGDETRLETGLLGARQPIWTPDGQALLFLGVEHVEPNDGFVGLDWWVHTLGDGDTVPTGFLERTRRLGLEGTRPRGQLLAPSAWLPGNREVVFDAGSGGDFRLWKSKILSDGWRSIGDPEPFTLGTGIVSHPSVTDSGSIAFARLNVRLDIASVPVAASAETAAMLTLVRDVSPTSRVTISRDGSKMVFVSTQSGYNNVLLMDVPRGEIRSLTDTLDDESSAVISPDGAWVAYRRGREMFMVPSSGGVSEKICDDCSAPENWWSDSSRILMGGLRLRSLDITTGDVTVLGEHSSVPFFDPRPAPNDRWVAFHMPMDELGNHNGERRRLFVARVSAETLAPEDEWLHITDGTAFEGFCWWSVEGDAIYYYSDRPGPVTIRRQMLDPETKRPVGEPDEILRLPGFAHTHASTNRGGFKLAVSADRIVFQVPNLSGNIWFMEPREGQ